MTLHASRGKRTRTPSPDPPSGLALGVAASDCTPEPPHKRLRLQPRVLATGESDAEPHDFALVTNVHVSCFSVIKALPKTKKQQEHQCPGTMNPLSGAGYGLPTAEGRGMKPVAGLSATRKMGHAQIFSGLGVHHPLTRRIAQWERYNASPWVLRTLAKGYRLQFAMRPPAFSEVIFTEARGQAGVILQQEIITLLEKKAVREVPLSQSRSGFYSRYFLVKKKGGGSVLSWTSEHSTDTSRLSSSRC